MVTGELSELAVIEPSSCAFELDNKRYTSPIAVTIISTMVIVIRLNHFINCTSFIGFILLCLYINAIRPIFTHSILCSI